MIGVFFVFILFLMVFVDPAFGQATFPNVNIDLDSFANPESMGSYLTLLLSMSIITLIPFFLISTTSFLRIVIVLGMIRQALQTNQSPPSSVIVGLAMFMTIFVMSPTFFDIYHNAVVPYQEGKINQSKAFELGFKPYRDFMVKFTRDKDLALFIEFSKTKYPDDYTQIPINILIPAFVISELKAAFQIGFLLFIPFLVIDLVISNILLSLGMFMLSPAMVSLPFKILLFVLLDGWNLIIRGLLTSFQ